MLHCQLEIELMNMPAGFFILQLHSISFAICKLNRLQFVVAACLHHLFRFEDKNIQIENLNSNCIAGMHSR